MIVSLILNETISKEKLEEIPILLSKMGVLIRLSDKEYSQISYPSVEVFSLQYKVLKGSPNQTAVNKLRNQNQARSIAATSNRSWQYLTDYQRKVKMLEQYIILGKNLQTPANIVLYSGKINKPDIKFPIAYFDLNNLFEYSFLIKKLRGE